MANEQTRVLYSLEPSAKRQGCLLLDVRMLFPYKNVDDLVFNFWIDGKETPDKLIFRDHDSNYIKYGKTYGERINVLGYPIIAPVKELFRPIELTMSIGFKNIYARYSFPIMTQLNKEKPFSVLRIDYIFDDNVFVLESSDYNSKHEILNRRIWINEDYNYPKRDRRDDLTILSMERSPFEEHAFRSQNVILPIAQNRKDFIAI